MPARIYLASKSPRRRELLRQINVQFELLLFRQGERTDADVDETPLAGEAPHDYVERLARRKAEGGVRRLHWRRLPLRPVLAADTTLDLDGKIIGKPESNEHAMETLRQLSGRSHRILTGLSISDDRRTESLINISSVHFRQMDDAEIRRYVHTGEPNDKAGAYGIQGRAAMFIERIEGSHSGIMGLPLFETAQLLKRFNLPVLD